MHGVAQKAHDGRRADQIDRDEHQQHEVGPEQRPVEPAFAGLYPIPHQIACQRDHVSVLLGR